MTTTAHYSSEEAAEALRYIVPTGSVADPILLALCNAIHIAHGIAPKSWSVSLFHDKVRLNFGPVEVFLIFRDHAWFPAQLPKRVRFEAASREPARHKWLQPADIVLGAHLPIAEAFETAKGGFRTVLENIRERFKTRSFLNAAARSAHSRGLIDHLESRLELVMPRPTWDVAPRPSAESTIPVAPEEPSIVAEEIYGFEGERRLYPHFRAERDRGLIRKAKDAWRARDPLLRCEVCNFSAELRYGYSYVEAHHRVPVSKLDGSKPTLLEDLACVCASCHRVLHLDPDLTVESLRERVAEVRR